MNSLGIDASSGDGVIDWAIAASRNIEFATIRASWGLTGVDTKFGYNLTNAHTNGIKVAPYHWFVPRLDAVRQAQWFCSHAVISDLPHMIDLEDSGTYRGYYGIGVEIRKFIGEVFRLTPSTCLIYVSPSYIANYLYDCHWLNEYPIVIAHWDATAPKFQKPLQTTRWQAWQFTGTAYAPYYGISQCKEAALYVYNGQV